MERIQQVETLEHGIHDLDRRGLRLCRASAVLVLILAAGVLIALLMPDAVSSLVEFRVTAELPRKLLFAFLVLALAFSLYSLWRQKGSGSARGALIHELVKRDTIERLAIVDPLTKTFNRRYLEEVIRREISRVERHDTSLTFLKIDIENLTDLTVRAGGEVGERILKDVAQLLKRGLRPTDVIVRYDPSEFLIVMSETSKRGALIAVRRLLEQTDELNQANRDVPGYPIELSYGVADYIKGLDVRDVLAAADHSVKLYRERA